MDFIKHVAMVVSGAVILGALFYHYFGWLGLAALAVPLCIFLRYRTTRWLPRNRVRSFRMRLHFLLRPGRGFATTTELWLRWSRFAMWRRSQHIRPELSAWQRFRHPGEHSAFVGRAQYRHGLRSSLEEHAILTAGPRTGKSVALGAMLIKHPGAAVVTSSKIDLVQATSAIRAQRGPVEILNPAGLGDVPSTIRFNPIDGCQDPSVAVRRADAFASAVSMKGSENSDYFSGKCSSYLRALFLAAATVGGDMRLVARWGLGDARDAERILAQAGHGQWADELSELRGEAQKSAATTRSVMSRALQFMNVPQLAEAVLPGNWDIEQFIRDKGTLYLVADSGSEHNPLAPIFSCVATEVAHIAGVVGSKMPGARLSPPLGLFLDEVCQVCPLPLAQLLSDAGGRGIRVVTVAHGTSALADRYGEHGAQTIMNTSGVKVWLGGSAEAKSLELITKLCGQMSQRERGQDHHIRHDVVTEAMARSLPRGYALIISGANAPVISKLPRYYKLPEFRQAKRRGGTVAALQPAAARVAVEAAPVPAVEAPASGPDPMHELLSRATQAPSNAWGTR
jgi:type IV secretion system protein VirD4